MNSALIGTWSWNGHLDCGYIFGSDGKGAYFFCGAQKAFEYCDNGTFVSIYYPGDLSPLRFEYTVDGNTLSIEDSFGNRIIYSKCDT